MKILINTDKGYVKESKPSKLDIEKGTVEVENDIIHLLALAIIGNARKNYKTEDAQRYYAKMICAVALKELGDSTELDELKEGITRKNAEIAESKKRGTEKNVSM